MESKNNAVAYVLVLLVGIVLGYFATGYTGKSQYSMMQGDMHRMDMGGTMDGMMAGLSGKTGADFEKAFLSEMVVHHQGAISMAEALLKNTTRPELIKMANDIISAQSSEISQMEAWQNEWFAK